MNNQFNNEFNTPNEIHDLEIIKKKIQNFYELQTLIHVKFKKGYFKNGYVKKILADFFILSELEDGIEYIFFLEIDRIDIYRKLNKAQKKREKKDGD